MKKAIKLSLNLLYSCIKMAIEKTAIFVLLILTISIIFLSSLFLFS